MRYRIDQEQLSEFLTRQVRLVEGLPGGAAEAAVTVRRHFPQRRIQIDANRLKRRRQTRDDAGHERGDGRECEDAPIGRHRQHDVAPVHEQRIQPRAEPPGQEETDAAANRCEDEALGQELSYQAAAPRANRKPH